MYFDLFNTIELINFGIFLRFRSKNHNLCFDDLQQNEDDPFNLGIYQCHMATLTKSQLFSFTHSGIIRSEKSCATVQQR